MVVESAAWRRRFRYAGEYWRSCSAFGLIAYLQQKTITVAAARIMPEPRI